MSINALIDRLIRIKDGTNRPDDREAINEACREMAERATEVMRMRKALHYYADFTDDPHDGPWAVNSDDFGTVARRALGDAK